MGEVEMSEFQKEVFNRLKEAKANERLLNDGASFLQSSVDAKYSYNFSWLGRPIIQYPQDILTFQEIIWRTKPDIIIETGIAHGGSLILSASLLAMIDMCEAIERKIDFNPNIPQRLVVGVDIDIRKHNRVEIEAHPLSNRIKMFEGSSIDPAIVEKVKKEVRKDKKVLVCLDSNHTHDHVLKELQYYAPLVSLDSYCIVFDTLIEDMPAGTYPDRPWGKGNNPKTALMEWLINNEDFIVDDMIDAKSIISVASGGFLKRVK
jgi:cephalosporin hydroxylase